MSPPGRPEGELRSAKHEGRPTGRLCAEWAALWRFLAAPRRLPRRHAPGWGWLPRSLAFAAAVLVVNIALTVLVLKPLAASAGIHEDLPEALGWRLVLLGGVFAPLFEEALMRAGLRRADWTLYAMPPLIAFVFGPGDTWNVFGAALALVLWPIGLAQHWRRGPARFRAGRRFVRAFGWVFWGHALAFALPHVGNYTGPGAAGPVVLAMVLPQFLMGTVAGYLRLRDGLRSSVAMHLVNNAVALSLWRWV